MVWFGGLGWLGVLLSLLFWAAVIAVAVILLRNEVPNLRLSNRPPALDLLEERYARGEISREEFLERRAVLLREPDSRSERAGSTTPASSDAATAPPPSEAAPAGPSAPVAEEPAAAEQEPDVSSDSEAEPTQPLPRKRTRSSP